MPYQVKWVGPVLLAHIHSAHLHDEAGLLRSVCWDWTQAISPSVCLYATDLVILPAVKRLQC